MSLSVKEAFFKNSVTVCGLYFLRKSDAKVRTESMFFINVISDLEMRSRSITIADFARKKYPPSHSPKLFFLQKFGAAACQHVSLIDAIHYDYSDEQTLCSASPRRLGLIHEKDKIGKMRENNLVSLETKNTTTWVEVAYSICNMQI